MTAHMMTDEVQRCLKAGMNDHVGKPIDPDALFATLERWTRGRRRDACRVAGPAARADHEISLPALEGVDVSSGLQRMGGNKRLYRDLLVQFVAKQENFGKKITQCLTSGVRHEAERLAHSLKGVAGNLGMQALFQHAGQLEREIRESASGVERTIEDLSKILNRQIQIIRTELKSGAPTIRDRQAAKLADPAEVRKAADHLQELLKSSDADAPQAFWNLAELLRPSVDPSQLNALGAAVESFDFETAQQRLSEIVLVIRNR